MAGNHLTLHTNDRVVVTTSRGNQEKWFDEEKNLWYKVDDGCFEALAEARIAAGGDRYYQRNLQTQGTPKTRLAAEPVNKAPRSTYAFLF